MLHKEVENGSARSYLYSPASAHIWAVLRVVNFSEVSAMARAEEVMLCYDYHPHTVAFPGKSFCLGE